MFRLMLRCLLIIAIITGLYSTKSDHAMAVYSLPATIQITMYRLRSTAPEGAILLPATQCSLGSQAFGCAAPGYSYPHNTGTPTINVETDYLLNVVPKELSPLLTNLSGLSAQAIAARSYMAYQLYNPDPNIPYNHKCQLKQVGC